MGSNELRYRLFIWTSGVTRAVVSNEYHTIWFGKRTWTTCLLSEENGFSQKFFFWMLPTWWNHDEVDRRATDDSTDESDPDAQPRSAVRTGLGGPRRGRTRSCSATPRCRITLYQIREFLHLEKSAIKNCCATPTTVLPPSFVVNRFVRWNNAFFT